MSANFVQRPRTSDGKEIVLPNLFRGDVYPLYVGRGDDVTNAVRFAGPDMRLQKTDAGDTSLEFQFINWIYLGGGLMSCKGADFGDRVNFKIYAPATAGEYNPGAGAYNKVEIVPNSGLHLYVPTAGSGAWDLDLEEKLNAKVDFTKVVPIPTTEGTGFFDWDYVTGAVTLNAQGKGNYQLFDFTCDLVHYVAWQQLLGDVVMDFIKPAMKPRRMLPHWVYKTDLHRDSTGTVSLAWSLLTARKDPKP